MDIKEEDFPMYQLLVKLGEPGVERAIVDFKAAQTGGDAEKFNFAMGIQTLAVPENRKIFGDIPGATEGMYQKTLESCLAVFKDVASRGHQAAEMVVANYAQRGIGGGTAPAVKSQKPKFKFF